MRNDEAKLSKLPKHLISLIIFLVTLLVLFLLIMLWYDRKINNIQDEEQKLRNDTAVLAPVIPIHNDSSN